MRSKNSSNGFSFLSQVLKEERKKTGMTQKEFAKWIGLGLMTLRKLEQNKENVTIKLTNELLGYFGKELIPSDIVSPRRSKIIPLPKKSEVLSKLSKLKPILRGKFGVIELGLFGSFSRGKQKKNSDLDILVSYSRLPTFSEEGKLLVMCENFFQGRKVDLTNKEEIKESLRESILNSVIYV